MSTYEEQKEQQKRYRERRKERILRTMGNKCAICGYNKCSDTLEVHHIKPEEKEFSISARPDISWERTSQELKKCVLLCANCHREYHAGLLNIELVSSFNQEICDEITLEVEAIKHRVEKRCCDCGIEISATATRCPTCAAKHARTVSNRPSGNELAKLVAEKGFLGVGRMFNVSDNAVRKWCKTDNLPTHRQEINDYVKTLES